jgi:predicted TIM-barrel fold metal-dependent hydrolase
MDRQATRPAARDRYTVISADCHAGADLLDYRGYLPAALHEEFDAWAADYVNPFADLVAPEADRNWDSPRRLAELESDGIAAEVVFPNTVPPFFPSASLSAPLPTGTRDFELRWAGLEAHNRWLADFCSLAPGRRAGVCQILLGDGERAAAEIRRSHEAGLFGGVLIPGVPPNSPVPELYSEAHDPVWAACAERGIPVNHHAGSAGPSPGETAASRAVFMVETTWFSHRALWHLLFGGVFRRFPELRLVLTEQGSGWIPGVLDMLEYYHSRLTRAASKAATAESKFGAGLADAVGGSPREYWARNCFVGASFMRAHEVPLRDRIGLDKIMWGSDYPHDEGVYPYTTEALRTAYAGLPEDEVAAMVGGNAARVYGFDLGALDALAAKIGPLVEEVAQPLDAPPSDATSPVFAGGGQVRVW